MSVRVSVVIPVYNVEAYIEKCLRSVVDQTLTDIEIVVVDDGTPDRSMEIVRRHAENDKRFRLLTHDCNKGLMQARRTGYMEAKGDYVIFCDSDDRLPANAVEILYNEAERTGADVVSGDMVLVYPGGDSERVRASELRYGSDMLSVYKSLLLSEYYHNLCGKIFRRSLLQDHEYITREHFTNGEDGYLFYQLVEHVNKVVHIHEPVYLYTQNPKSSSRIRHNRNAILSICLLNQLRDQLSEKYPEIRKYGEAKVSSVISNLYASGYHKDAGLDEFVKQLSLSKYSTLMSLFRYNSLPRAFKLLSKRLL